MRKKKVWRYYCDFCKKSGCSGGHLKKHEKHCTMNPDRHCRMCGMIDAEQVGMRTILSMLPDPTNYIIDDDCGLITFNGLDYAIAEILPKLRELVGNCPACILAGFRQKGIPVPCVEGFDFKQECKDIWAMINEANAERDYY